MESTNFYYKETVNNFFKLGEEKSRLEGAFIPGSNQQPDYLGYADVCSKYTKVAAELLKLGVDKYLSENAVVITIQNDTYPVSKTELQKLLSHDEWNLIFGVNDEPEEDENEEIPPHAYGEQIPPYPNPYPMMNPLGALLTSVLTPLMNGAGMQQYTQQPITVQQEHKEPERDLLDDITAIQRKVMRIEKEKEAASADYESLKKKYEDLQENTSKVSDLESELREKADEIEKLTGELNKTKEQKNIEIHNLQNELSMTQEKHKKEMTKAVKDAEDRLNAKLSGDKKDKQRIKELESKVESLQRKLEEADKKNNELKAKYGNLQDEAADYTETVRRLEKLAYEDDKFDVKNGNAFNLQMSKVNREKSVLIRLGIRDIKAVNDQNMQFGDNMIRMVASALSDKFGRKNIYRVMGDQFIVLLEDEDASDYYEKLTQVVTSLAEEQIRLAYGVSVGATAKDIQAFFKKAEEEMSAMKLMDNSGITAGEEAAKVEPGVESMSIYEDLSSLMK